jgi:hypothetical protein
MTTRHVPARRRSLIRTLALGAALVMGLLLVGAGTPVAAETVVPETVTYTAVGEGTVLAAPHAQLAPAFNVDARIIDDVDLPPDREDAERSLYDSQNRTINRWGDSTTSFFTKYDGFVGTQLIDQAQRGVTQSLQMSWGNFFATATSNAAQWAVSFDAIDSLGKSIDDITKQIVKALFTADGNGGATTTIILTSVIVILAISVIWQSVRRGGLVLMLRRFAGIVVILGLIFAMAAASLAQGTTDKDGGYHPVVLSPGWVVKTVNDSVSTIAEVPATLFVDGMQTLNTADESKTEDRLSCTNLRVAMLSALSNQQERANAAGSAGLVGITAVMDQLWEETGLQTWKNIQTGFGNEYGENVYCRILESRSSTATPTGSAWLTAGGAGLDYWKPVFSTHKGDNAPFSPDSALNESATYVGWAACRATGVSGDKITWQWADGWVGFQGGMAAVGGAAVGDFTTDNAPELCGKWWDAVKNGDSAQDIPDEFDISGQAGWIDDRTRGIDDAHRDEVRDFLYALTGVNAMGGATATLAFLVSAFLQLVAFGFLAVLTFLTKLFCAMFAFSLWFVLLGALFSESPFRDRLAKAFNRFLGMVIFASMMTAIMTFVVMFSRVLISLGNMFGPGSIFSMLWSGFAPLTALILVHLLFTKVFKMPSPVTIGGARAWHKAGASGALGTAAAAGVGAGVGSGIANALGNRARAEGKKAGSAALHKATGGRFGSAYAAGTPRRSSMGAGASREKLDDKGDEKAQTLSPREVRTQVVQDRKRELAEARAWHRAETGLSAPGDFAGALGDARVRGADRARVLAQKAQDKLAATPLSRELHARADHRQALRAARESGDTGALQKIRDEQRAQLRASTARMAAVMDAPAAVATRARLGVEAAGTAASQKAQAVWTAPRVVGARADAAVLAGGTRSAVDFVKQSDIGKGTAVVSRYAAAPVRLASRGTAAVAQRSKNNASVIEQYRSAMAVKAAQQPERQKSQTRAEAVTVGAQSTRA